MKITGGYCIDYRVRSELLTLQVGFEKWGLSRTLRFDV